MASAHLPVGRSVALASLACCLMQGCGMVLWSGVKPVPCEEVDAHGTSLGQIQNLGRSDRAESVLAVLGEPADRRPSCVPGEVVWRYPIRAWNDMARRREIVPAVLLRVRFDTSGTLTEWRFVEPVSGRPLAVRETLDDASAWFASLADAPAPVPPLIELNHALVRGHTMQREVERVLGQWQPDLHCGSGGPVPVVKKRGTEFGSVWDWYVDRPSPFFIPPHFLVVAFDSTGALRVWHLEQTYPGGRK